MGSEGVVSMMSVVEDVLKQQGNRLNDVDLASRKAEETASRRYEAAGWLRKTVGIVAAKDLPEEPSEEEFRLGLRSGMILCNVLNKVVPGAIPKVVETPGDSVIVPDGAALSAYQYFENVRNFLVTLQDMGLPTFEASDLEQVKTTSKDLDDGGRFISKPKVDILEKNCTTLKAKGNDMNLIDEEAPKNMLLKQCTILAQQERDIQNLKHILHTTKAGMQYMKAQYSEEFNNLGKHLYSLSHAASGYHKVLEENRKLYNQVQDLKGNIRVYCRVRPFLPGQSSIMSSVGRIDDGSITLITPLKYGKEEEVFSDTQALIRSVLDGYNVCIFAYGQTGSGKTYTMVRISQKGLNVPDASLIPVTSTSEVIELMNIGQRNRAVGATALNDRSSRSHSCLTIHVQGRDMASGTILRGCMHLVDLAGSERVDKSEAKGERLKEAQHINKSLSALGDVIAALAQKNSHVPYRNSKLTQLLQDSLGGQAKTLMFVHISPEADAIGETISTLKFAERVATVELGSARLNKESGEVKELKEQIVSLKAALARKDGDSEYIQSTMSSPDLLQGKLVEHYLHAQIDSLMGRIV
ncbi:hypothetical protein J5N97_018345 [Dioscorea zingiberensis]|uniref:Uncharacterized protein n=1 Tax=Dioscorea zingiberensis TaxID=325984 RepID=A0A9D5HH61_9LILI|nr:hypothetical protein J5N97_018345 [Dioscorea zingiberensis]